MPKPINTENPIAAIRASLDLPIEDFAQFIGCGVSTLKQIESGRREIGIKLAETISLKTAVPLAGVLLKKWTKVDQAKYTPRVASNFGSVDDNEPAQMVPDLFALYHLLSERGVDGRFGLMAIRRAIKDCIKRWGVSEDDFEGFQLEYQSVLFGVSGSRQGIDKPKIDVVIDTIAETQSRKAVALEIEKFNERLSKAVYHDRRENKGLFNGFIGEHISRARHKKPKSKTGAFAALADGLPMPPYAKKES